MSLAQLREKEKVILEILFYIDSRNNGAFVLPNSLESTDLLRLLPDFELYRSYKFKLAAIYEDIAKIAETEWPFNKYMDLCFQIAAEYALLGNAEDKLNEYVKKIQWSKWHPLNDGDQDTILAYLQLAGRAGELKRKKSS